MRTIPEGVEKKREVSQPTVNPYRIASCAGGRTQILTLGLLFSLVMAISL